MTVVTQFFTLDNKEGIDLNNIQTSVNVNVDPSVPAPRSKLGDDVLGNNGSHWIFVQASATVTCYNMVAIDTNFQARNASTAVLASGIYSYGVAEFAPNQLGATVSVGNNTGGVVQPGDYFWAAMRIAGGGQINCVTTALAGARLFISTTPGVMTTTASTWYFPGIGIVVSAATAIVSTCEYVQAGYLIPTSL